MVSIHLKQSQDGNSFYGARSRSKSYGREIKSAFTSGESVELDFSGVDATQSFVDELIGRYVLELGPEILSRCSFKGCNEDMVEIIKLVISARLSDHKRLAKEAG